MKGIIHAIRGAGNTMNGKLGLRLVAAIAAALVWAATAAAQTVVVGTGNPTIDVPAVQAVVNQGGQTVLTGHFSFNAPPTVPTSLPAAARYPQATILVSKAVDISGVPDATGEIPTIEGGTIPFYVEAPGASVAIQGLRFVRPTTDAILVFAVSGLTIADCKIDGIVPLANTGESSGIEIDTSGLIPSPVNPGKPENISGVLRVVNNDIDLAGGTASDNTIGVLVWSVGMPGVPGAEVEVYVSGNNIRNGTEPAINFRRVGGRAYIEDNVLTTGPVSSLVNPGPEVIRVANIGSYLIAHNSIHCRWADPAAKGIGVFSQFAAWTMEGATVVDNDVSMEAPAGTVFVPGSTGIDIRGFAQGNGVLNNRISGSARTALSVDVFKGGIPNNNAFVLNRFDDFVAALADVFVDVGVTNTLVVGPGTIEDHGTGTVIVPVPF